MSKNIEEIAAQAATQTFRRKEVEGELNFVSNLDELDAALEADTIVCRFANPTDPEGEPIDFEMEPMTPGQFSIYYQTLFGHTLLDGERIGDEIPNPDEERLQDELAVKKYDERLLNILETNIISHPGLTAERMRKWNPFYIIRLHNALLTGSRPSKAVARFPNMDTARSEQG